MPKIRVDRSPSNIPGKITSYNGTATAGIGVSVIVASGTLSASTANGATIATFTPATAGVFEVGVFFKVSSYTSGNVGVKLNFTDALGGSQSFLMIGEVNATSSNASSMVATGSFSPYSQTVASGAAAITLQTSNTGTATATYWAWIRQVA